MTNYIYLASQSPRRAELLTQIGVNFKQFSVNINESVESMEKPLIYLNRIVLQKLQAAVCIKSDDIPILVADTIVVLNGKIMGKPADFKEYNLMLNELSGTNHLVYTAVNTFAKKHTIAEILGNH